MVSDADNRQAYVHRYVRHPTEAAAVMSSASGVVPPRVSLAESVARELERAIDERHEHGERLGTKHELRDRFGVAVATMNEALRLLEARGIVTARPGPGGGVFVGGAAGRLAFSHLVLGLSEGSLAYSESLEIREALEPVICAHAARYHRAADIRALEQILDRMSGTDPAVYFEANWALHRRIARICQNLPLRAMYLALTDQLEATVSHAEIGAFDFRGFRNVHKALVAAIDVGEGEQLDRAVAGHGPFLSIGEPDSRHAARSRGPSLRPDPLRRAPPPA
jgi:DNA-binding FadR family transcriptional regulator